MPMAAAAKSAAASWGGRVYDVVAGTSATQSEIAGTEFHV
jgi:hypothetical protein